VFVPEPAATAKLSPFIIEWIQQSPKPFDPSWCLPAVAAGSGLSEISAITYGVFEIAQLQNLHVG
jgi:hypothetical protein